MSNASRKPIEWTDERRAFVEENIYHTPYAKLTEMFNEHFGTNLKVTAIRAFAKRNGLKNGLDGKFQKGQVSHNKGKKMPPEIYEKAKATMFRKGQRPPRWRPCGSERISRDGYIEVKVDGTRRWQLKQRIVWENAYGKIPSGHTLLFLDGDKTNCELSNLKLITRSELLIMNRYHLTQGHSELNDVASNLAKCIDVRHSVIKKHSKKRKDD